VSLFEFQQNLKILGLYGMSVCTSTAGQHSVVVSSVEFQGKPYNGLWSTFDKSVCGLLWTRLCNGLGIIYESVCLTVDVA